MKRRASWKFIARRWWKCRRNGHMLRRFKAGSRQWNECYCGLVCVPVDASPDAPTETTDA